MKTRFIAAVALAALTATAASAQPAERGRFAQPLTRAALQARVDAGFARVDANRDGFIAQDEARAAGQARRAGRGDRGGDRAGQRAERSEQRGERRAEVFARLDTNRDGMINRAEFENRQRLGREERAERRADRAERRGVRGERRGGQGGGMFARFGGRAFGAADVNHDGRVSRAEARNGALALFARVDTNRDGAISADERRVAREGMRSQRQGRRQG
jgi:hypothetical protein